MQWFQFTLNKQILIDIKVDKKLVAGAYINFNGKFKDYSIKTNFDGIIEQKLNTDFSNQRNKVVSA